MVAVKVQEWQEYFRVESTITSVAGTTAAALSVTSVTSSLNFEVLSCISLVVFDGLPTRALLVLDLLKKHFSGGKQIKSKGQRM